MDDWDDTACQTADESEVASMKKDINNALGADYYDRKQALDNRFIELRLGTPEQNDYKLMEDAIAKRLEAAESWDAGVGHQK